MFIFWHCYTIGVLCFWVDFEIISILTYLNLTDPGFPHLTGGSGAPPDPSSQPQKIWPLTASIIMISNSAPKDGTIIVHQCPFFYYLIYKCKVAKLGSKADLEREGEGGERDTER